MKNKIIYVDAAASSQKPESVIRAEADFLKNHYANAGRGICARATDVDDMVTNARRTIAKFIGAKSSDQIIFTSGTTDGLNRIPHILENSYAINWNSFAVASDLDHHSARMPWEEFQHLGRCGFGVCPLDNDFNIDAGGLTTAFKLSPNGRTRIRKPDVFVITAMSNVLGTPQNVKDLVKAAKACNRGVITIVDAAQYIAHLPIDVSDWDCDFLCFSGHKIGADTGIGVMYIKDPKRWHPDKFGGGMVASITGSLATNDSRWTLAAAPANFEAGTLPLTQIAGLRVAIEEREKGIKNKEREIKLLEFLRKELSKIPRIKFISPAGAHLLTFVIDGMHPLDFGAMAGAKDVCLRVGNMCASWIHARLGLSGTIRISVGPWNTMAEMKELIRIIKEIIKQ